MRVVIVDYGSGNLRSAEKAFQRAAAEHGIDARVSLTDRAEEVRAADRVVLPGVGAFADCRAGLERLPGMMEALGEAALRRAVPFLGICVGMQLMATRGLEHGGAPGFDWIPGEVRPITPDDARLKIPHMGWNTLEVTRPHPVFDGLPLGANGMHAYFVHSYHFVPRSQAHLLARTDYGGPVTAAVGRVNLLGFQFHPEKSQKLGLELIGRFLQWRP
ncbi:MAG TPA: imidazole glycerol phosphate synthase subunit HisH [Thermopetrobacter sp.]|nr:imidazole glycerol phosphate synthase subunit HisH [Thermopetrobacter sp.]